MSYTRRMVCTWVWLMPPSAHAPQLSSWRGLHLAPGRHPLAARRLPLPAHRDAHALPRPIAPLQPRVAADHAARRRGGAAERARAALADPARAERARRGRDGRGAGGRRDAGPGGPLDVEKAGRLAGHGQLLYALADARGGPTGAEAAAADGRVVAAGGADLGKGVAGHAAPAPRRAAAATARWRGAAIEKRILRVAMAAKGAVDCRFV
ncbi:MAG: hypothetical protein J3K34DRAFT_426249 [Monoraphidium minutum]|nr:MAG: hypothetical protein J3K34DRAFT_426249 [Monoraphidium minutum]